jgi:hypothetical protein
MEKKLKKLKMFIYSKETHQKKVDEWINNMEQKFPTTFSIESVSGVHLYDYLFVTYLIYTK